MRIYDYQNSQELYPKKGGGGLLLYVNYSLVNKRWWDAISEARSVMSPFYRWGKVKESWSPEHTQLPLTFFGTDFFMALGGQAAQEGLPERKLESVHLPTVFEPGAGAQRMDSRWRGDLELAPRGRCDAASQTLRGSAVTTMLQQTLEHAVRENFGAEKQNFCGTNTVPGSQWVHHPFLGNYWNGEGGGNLEEGASEMWMVCRISWLVHRWAQMSCWAPNNGIFKQLHQQRQMLWNCTLFMNVLNEKRPRVAWKKWVTIRRGINSSFFSSKIIHSPCPHTHSLIQQIFTGSLLHGFCWCKGHNNRQNKHRLYPPGT